MTKTTKLPPLRIEVSPANIFERLRALKKELEAHGCKVSMNCSVEFPLHTTDKLRTKGKLRVKL
ncbi:MAG: hypothetical protein C5B54_10250 [Acidobacteria bacterium]|nr:MAG: hypothetical protein C5B54_10250 [Acidobacteriota bacterium]